MIHLRFVQVDAFADRPFIGNPAAVMPLDRWLDDDLLTRIAAENNLAETAFLVPASTGDADYELRWFTPTIEVAMCGHATLASGHVLLTDHPAKDRIRFATRQAGLLEVRRAGSGYDLDLPTLKPEPCEDRRGADALGVEPVATLFREGGYHVTVLENETQIRALRPDFKALAAAIPGPASNIFTAPGDETDFVSRMFAPGAGIDEDPVTGSAHAVLTPYWSERLGKPRLTAFQASERGGSLTCALAGDRVTLGGQCVTVIEGVFRVSGN